MNLPNIKENTSRAIDFVLIIVCLATFLSWFSNSPFFHSNTSPVISPFTCFSLLLMTICRLAPKFLNTWSKPMSLALLSVVACGNLSSLWIQLTVPQLFVSALPSFAATSAMTSAGLILYCCYDILVVIRKTPQSAFILDDILLHLALFPGGLSLLGHMLTIPEYISTGLDPRVGIGVVEMVFMGTYAVTAVLSNPHLFLWKFLASNPMNRMIFIILFINQYVAPLLIGMAFQNPAYSVHKPGIELYVMIAGVLATLIFLTMNAVGKRNALNDN